MGCRLPKLRKAEERRSPGNIYSTLRRPQVETKVDVAYTYHFLDFLLGKEEVPVSSVLCLSSVRELPVQVRELYAQGFVLVAVHPFVHPCGPSQAHIQRQLHRAVLVRETPSSEAKWARRRLETDVCVAGHQGADPEAIQCYVKRIQDGAEQGAMFVGFLQQPGAAPFFLGGGGGDPDDLSSLHSSPSPIHRHPSSGDASPATEPDDESEAYHARDLRPLLPAEAEPGAPKAVQAAEPSEQTRTSQIGPGESPDARSPPRLPFGAPDTTKPLELRLPEVTETSRCTFKPPRSGRKANTASESRPRYPGPDGTGERKVGSGCVDGRSRATTQNNNHIRLKNSDTDVNQTSQPTQTRTQLFALYNAAVESSATARFYSLRVPLRVRREAGLVTDVDANWLDHMTQHFTSGALLTDGFFHLGDNNDNGVSSLDGVFIFHSPTEETANASYDAIVVEQWTVVDGVMVKTDYVPLLQSLAPYGWRLMCVLATPIVKSNSDGSLSTKQILFLQRPVLQRKRKDFKMPNLRGRGKAKKTSDGETAEERENRSPLMGTEMDELRRRGSWDGSSEDGGGDQVLAVPWGGREEETDIDGVLDVCHGDGEPLKVKREVKTEERIKHQLFSGVC